MSHKKIFSANSRDLVIVQSSCVKSCCAACKHPRCHGNKWCNRAANKCQILNETRERCSDDRNNVKSVVRTKCYQEFDHSQVGDILQRWARELRRWSTQRSPFHCSNQWECCACVSSWKGRPKNRSSHDYRPTWLIKIIGLRMKKVCAKIVPKVLTDEQKECRIDCYWEMISSIMSSK